MCNIPVKAGLMLKFIALNSCIRKNESFKSITSAFTFISYKTRGD